MLLIYNFCNIYLDQISKHDLIEEPIEMVSDNGSECF